MRERYDSVLIRECLESNRTSGRAQIRLPDPKTLTNKLMRDKYNFILLKECVEGNRI